MLLCLKEQYIIFDFMIRIKLAKCSEFNQALELIMKTGELNIPTSFY